MLISLVIDNYDSEKYVARAVESVLAQTHPDTEVVVVDDGSTDGSRAVLDRYADSVELVFKANGGQASALNAGFASARGEIVIFLDGDDFLMPEAAATVASSHRDSISRYQWYLGLVDDNGRRRDGRIPVRDAEGGDLEARALSHGPRAYICPPTSGNAWSRAFLEQVMPLPEAMRTGGDQYLTDTAPLFGEILTIDRELSFFRVHRASTHISRRRLDTHALKGVAAENEVRVDFLAARARSAGKQVPDDLWAGRDWRMLVVRTLLHRAGESTTKPRLPVLVGATLRSRRIFPVRVLLALFATMVALAPRRMAFALSQRVLNLEYM